MLGKSGIQRICAAVACGAITSLSYGQLFVDTFDRSTTQLNDINLGLPTGQSGALAPANWVDRGQASDPLNRDFLTNIENNQLHLADGPQASLIYLDHNFVDADFITAGGMTIKLDIVNNDGTLDDTGRYCGFGLGATSEEAAKSVLDFDATAGDPNDLGWRGRITVAGDGMADFGVYWARPCGTDDQNGAIQVFQNGTLTETIEDTENCFATGATLELRLAFADFNQGSPVVAEVHYNGVAIKTYRFVWDNTNANYIGISCRQNGAGFTADNFSVAAGAVIENPPGEIWTGAGADANWGTADNWEGGLPDFASGMTELIFPASANYAPVNEAARTVADIKFGVDALPYTISGQPITVNNQVLNNSPELQTVTATIISDNATLNASLGDMTLAVLDANSPTTVSTGISTTNRKTLTINSLIGDGEVTLVGEGIIALPNDNSSFNGQITLPLEDNTILLASNNNALGNPNAITFLGGGQDHWLALEGDVTIPENIEFEPKGTSNNTQVTLVNNSGDNTMSGTLTMVRDASFENRTALGIYVADGRLTLNNPINFTLDGTDEEGDPLTNPLRIVGLGSSAIDTDVLALAFGVTDDSGAADPNLNKVAVEARAGLTLELNGAGNTYSGHTQVYASSNLILNNAIPNSTPISVVDPLSVLDASPIGGLTLGNQELSGVGTVYGGVTASGGSVISPGNGSNGTLTIEDGLTLQSGSVLAVTIGDNGDLLQVPSGSISSAAGVAIELDVDVPIQAGVYPVIDFTGATNAGLDDSDFSVTLTGNATSIVASANAALQGTQLVVTITLQSGADDLTEVLAWIDGEITLLNVQNGVWGSRGPWLIESDFGPITVGDFAVDPNTGDIWGFGQNGTPRIVRFDKSGFPVEIVAQGGGVDFDGALNNFCVMGPNGDFYFLTSNPNTIQVVRDGVVIELVGSGEFATGLTLSDTMRGIAVVGDRLFTCDRGIGTIYEFSAIDGAPASAVEFAFVDAPQGLTYDEANDRLVVGSTVPTADNLDAYTLDGFVDQYLYTNPGFFNTDDAIPLGVHNFIWIDNEIYTAAFQQDQIIKFNTNPVTDTYDVKLNIANPAFIHGPVDVTTAGRFDIDLDDDVDGADAALWLPCGDGPNNAPLCDSLTGRKADSDNDGDVDMADVAEIQVVTGTVGL